MHHDDLSHYLDSLERESRYRVVETLKSSPLETTEKVMLAAPDGTEEGPFIRKRIKRESGMGGAYARIHDAQRAGMRLSYVPTIVECYPNDDELVTVTEFVNGQTLLDYVYENDPSVMLAAWLFPLLCDAASELHEAFDPPIIHRDLKPSNIIVSPDRLAIIDFGIAREFKDTAAADTTQFGTRAYAPPEQFGFGQTDVRSDVYALGMLLYFLLTEKTPSPKTVQKRFADADIPEPLRKVVDKATSLDPAARFESAAELKTAFATALMQAGPTKQVGMSQPHQAFAGPSAPSASAVATEAMAQHTRQAAGATGARERPSFPAPPASQAGADGRFSRLGKAWNVMLLVTFALMLVACLDIIADPPPSAAGNPWWYNVAAYLFIVPAMMALVIYALMDKRRLRQRFAPLGRLKRWQEVLVWVGAFALVLAATQVITALSGG